MAKNKTTTKEEVVEEVVKEVVEAPISMEESNEGCANTNLDITELFVEIPAALSVEQESMLEELTSHKYYDTKDETIIAERDAIVSLDRAVRIKHILINSNKETLIDSELELIACRYYREVKKTFDIK